jgi:hypothetical protein
VAKDARVHQFRFIDNNRLEIHLREDVALDIDPGRHLSQFEPVGGQGEHTAFRDITGCARDAANGPLNVTCSTRSMNFATPSLTMESLPGSTAKRSPPAAQRISTDRASAHTRR